MDIAGILNQAGTVRTFSPAAPWWVASPQHLEGMDPEELSMARRDWEEPWSHRRQEIVFIGGEMPADALRELLETCLLTDAEMEARPEGWMELEDPLPWMDPGGGRRRGGGRSAPGPSSLEA